MNAGTLILGIGTALVVGVGAAIMLSDDEDEPEKPVEPPEITAPPIDKIDVPNFPAVSIPPSAIEILGGTYVDGVGWCPPMYQYDPVTGLCAPLVIAEFPFPYGQLTQTQGDSGKSCCASCATGGPCTGCG